MKNKLAIVPDSKELIALPAYEDMCKAIATCHRVDEVKQIRDKAEAVKAYCRQVENKALEVQFAEIKLRAERRAGELLIEMRESGERQREDQGRPQEKKVFHDETHIFLADLGIDRNESHRFQQVAKVPEVQFEATLQEARDNEKPATSSQVRQIIKPKKEKKIVNPIFHQIAQELLPNGKPLSKGDPDAMEVWVLLQRWEETYFSDRKMTPEYIVMGIPRDFWPDVVRGSEKMIALLTKIIEVIHERAEA